MFLRWVYVFKTTQTLKHYTVFACIIETEYSFSFLVLDLSIQNRLTFRSGCLFYPEKQRKTNVRVVSLWHYLCIISVYQQKSALFSFKKPFPVLTRPLHPAASCRWRSPAPDSVWYAVTAHNQSWFSACPGAAVRVRPPAVWASPADARSQACTSDSSLQGSPPEHQPWGHNIHNIFSAQNITTVVWLV